MRRTPSFYRERGQAYDKRLAALDQWIKAEIAKVPAAQRRAITAHDSFRYFTAAYGVQFFAPRGFTTESEPSAKDVAALIRQVREQKIKALFVENMSNPGLIDQIAREFERRGRAAALQRCAVGTERPGADLRGDDAPQRDGAGCGDDEELTPFRRFAPPSPQRGRHGPSPPPSYGGGREGEGRSKSFSQKKIMI